MRATRRYNIILYVSHIYKGHRDRSITHYIYTNKTNIIKKKYKRIFATTDNRTRPRAFLNELYIFDHVVYDVVVDVAVDDATPLARVIINICFYIHLFLYTVVVVAHQCVCVFYILFRRYIKCLFISSFDFFYLKKMNLENTIIIIIV